jgi:hypothetical protein
MADADDSAGAGGGGLDAGAGVLSIGGGGRRGRAGPTGRRDRDATSKFATATATAMPTSSSTSSSSTAASSPSSTAGAAAAADVGTAAPATSEGAAAPSLVVAIAFAFVGVVAQIVAALVLSIERSLMEPKYLIAASIPFFLLMLGGLRAFRISGGVAGGGDAVAVMGGAMPGGGRPHRLAPGGPLDAMVVGLFVAVQLAGFTLAVCHPGYGHQDVRAAADLIAREFRRGDAIVTLSPSTLAPLYNEFVARRRAFPLFLYLGEGGSPPPFYEGLGALPRATYIADADLLAAGQRRLWLLFPTWRDRDWEYGDAGRAIEAEAVRKLHQTLAGIEPPAAPHARFTRLEVYLMPVEREFSAAEMWPKWRAWMSQWQQDQRSSALGGFLRPEPLVGREAGGE